MDRVSHPFDHLGPYTEERGSCPCSTHVAQRRLVRRTKFTTLSSLRVLNLSTCRPQAQARRRRKQVYNILKHFYKLLNFNINRLLTEREGQYSPVRPEQARLVSGLLYGTVSDSKMPWHSVSDSKMPWHSVSDSKMQLQKRFVTESDKGCC